MLSLTAGGGGGGGGGSTGAASMAFWWKRKIRELFQCAAGFYYLKINLVKTR